MKILKPKPRILVYEKLKGTPQFKKLMAKYKIQKKLRKITKETIIDQIKNEMEKNESDDDYIIKELKKYKISKQEMINVYGSKAMERPNNDFENIQKKVSNKVKLRKLSFFVSPLFNPSQLVKTHYDNNYFNSRNKNFINLPSIFPKKRNFSLRNNLREIDFSDFSEPSSERINLTNTRSVTNCSFPKKLGNSVSAKSLLDSLDNIKNEYINSSRFIANYSKIDKIIFERKKYNYNNINNKFIEKMKK